MNKKKLKAAEKRFFDRYPGGFLDPEMQAVAKKHNVEKLVSLAKDEFSKKKFSDPVNIAENMVKIVGRSSMVSMFEKPKFRDIIQAADEETILALAGGLKQFLHGKQSKGFDALIETLKQNKLAKWSLITVIPNYYWPDAEVFVKPTTAKGVIEYFELDHLSYKPQPTWAFYEAYRGAILEMRGCVDELLAPNNAAFCGFLMMSLPKAS